MRPTVRAVAALATVALLAGCGDQVAGAPGPGSAPTTTSPTTAPTTTAPPPSTTPASPQLADLEAAMQRWEAEAPASYRFVYELHCFCPPTSYRIDVVDGEIVAAAQRERDTDGAFEPVTASELAYLPTVEELFADLRRAYVGTDADADAGTPTDGVDDLDGLFDGPAARVDVTYDDALGHPTDVFIDWSEMAADEETGYVVASVEPLPATTTT